MVNKQIINQTLKEFFKPEEDNPLLDDFDITILTELLTQALEKGNK